MLNYLAVLVHTKTIIHLSFVASEGYLFIYLIAESDFAIPFVDENDYSEISAKAVSAKPKLKKNRPSSLV